MIDIKEIGYARNPEPPDPGPSEEERVEHTYAQIQADSWYIGRCFEGDEKLIGRLARALAMHRDPHTWGVDKDELITALNDWLDSELMDYAKIITKEKRI